MHRVIFTSFNNKVCCDIAYFNTKMSHLSYFKRTKSKTLRIAKQTEDEFTFEMDTGNDVLAIDIYNFIRA